MLRRNCQSRSIFERESRVSPQATSCRSSCHAGSLLRQVSSKHIFSKVFGPDHCLSGYFDWEDRPRSTSRWISKLSCSSSTSLPRARQAWDYCGEDGPSSRAKSSRFPTTRPQPPALAVWVQSRDPATWTRPPVGRGSGRTATTLGTCRWRCWGGGEEVGWRDKGQVGRICKQSCRAPSTRGFLGRGRDTGGCSSCSSTVKIQQQHWPGSLQSRLCCV